MSIWFMSIWFMSIWSTRFEVHSNRFARFWSCRFRSRRFGFMSIWFTQFDSSRFCSINSRFNQFASRIMVEEELANRRRNVPWMLTVSRRLRFRFVVLRFRLQGFQDRQFVEVVLQFCRFRCKGSDDGIVLFIFNDVSRVLKTAET